MSHHLITAELEKLVERIVNIRPGDGVGQDGRVLTDDFQAGYMTAVADIAVVVTDRAADLRSRS